MSTTTAQPSSAHRPQSQLDEVGPRIMTLLSEIQGWITRHRDRVSYGILRFENGGFDLTVIGTTKRYDYQLGEQLAEFTISLADEGFQITSLLFPALDSYSVAGRVIRITPE